MYRIDGLQKKRSLDSQRVPHSKPLPVSCWNTFDVQLHIFLKIKSTENTNEQDVVSKCPFHNYKII